MSAMSTVTDYAHPASDGDPMSRHEVEEEIHDEEAAHDAVDPEYFKMYWRALNDRRCQWCILIFWLMMFILGLIYAPMLADQTELDLVAPHGTAAYIARHHFRQHFPNVVKGYNMLVRMNCKGCSEDQNIDDADTDLEDLLSDLKRYVYHFNDSWNDIIFNYTDLYTSYNACTPDAGASAKEYQLEQACRNGSRESLVSSDGKTSMALISHKRSMTDTDRDEWLNYMKKRRIDLNAEYGDQIKTTLTGNMHIWVDMQEDGEKSVDSHLYVVPVILLVFGYTVGSWRVTPMPFIAFMICISISFMIMYPIARDEITVATIAPALMTSICLAMCIDYNLFLLVRFREEVGPLHRESMLYSEYLTCVKNTMRWSGEVILVSGFILALSLMGYIFCNLDFLKSFGIGCALTVSIAISLNLSLFPVVLITFPEFFGEMGLSCRMLPIIYDDVQPVPGEDPDDEVEMTSGTATDEATKAAETDTADRYGAVDEAAMAGAGGSASAGDGGHGAPTRSKYIDLITDDPFDPWPLGENDDTDCFNQCWYRCGIWTTLMPCSVLIIIVTYLLILPISAYATDMKIQYAENSMIPRNSQAWAIFNRLGRDFGKGILMNYNMLIPNPTGDVVWNSTYITDTATIFSKVRNQFNGTRFAIRTVMGVSVIGTTYFTDAAEYEYIADTSVYHKNVDAYVDDEDRTSYFTFLSHDNPNGYHCRRLIKLYRPAFKKFCRVTKSGITYRCFMYSTAVETIDTVTNLYQTFPWILMVTMIVVFAICGYVWQNLFLPFRLFLTIAMPLIMVFGWAVLVYQYGMLNYWHSAAFKEHHGLCWLIPLMTITLCFGLALDYDIFLWTRIVEYLEHGVPLRQSVVRAVCKSGNIITAAGVIMAFAFGGLFFSNCTGLNQAGFLFVVSVLIDTFVIRTSLVPAILALNLTYNVWHPEWKVRMYGWYDDAMEWMGYETPVRDFEATGTGETTALIAASATDDAADADAETAALSASHE